MAELILRIAIILGAFYLARGLVSTVITVPSRARETAGSGAVAAAVELRACERCGTYVTAGVRCGRSDCPQ